MIFSNTNRTIGRFFVFLILLGHLTFQGQSYAQELNSEEKAKEIIVMIKGEIHDRDGIVVEEVFGAGIIVGFETDDQDWPTKVYIATAKHVVVKNGIPRQREAENIKVFFKSVDEKEELSAEIVEVHEQLDLALLEVTQLNPLLADALTVLPFSKAADASSLECIGEVKAIGNPQGNSWYTPRSPDGFLSVSENEEEIHFESRTIQVGNSGGGLFDKQWNLVGMVIEDSPPTAKALQISTVIENIDKNYPVKLVVNPSTSQNIRVSEYIKKPDICVKEGDEIIIDAWGSIRVGQFVGFSSPEGITTGFLDIPIEDTYNIIRGNWREYHHAVLMYRIAQENEDFTCDGINSPPHEDCEWYPYDPYDPNDPFDSNDSSNPEPLKASKNGFLEFTINDVDLSDNAGYYEVAVSINGEGSFSDWNIGLISAYKHIPEGIDTCFEVKENDEVRIDARGLVWSEVTESRIGPVGTDFGIMGLPIGDSANIAGEHTHATFIYKFPEDTSWQYCGNQCEFKVKETKEVEDKLCLDIELSINDANREGVVNEGSGGRFDLYFKIINNNSN